MRMAKNALDLAAAFTMAVLEQEIPRTWHKKEAVVILVSSANRID